MILNTIIIYIAIGVFTAPLQYEKFPTPWQVAVSAFNWLPVFVGVAYRQARRTYRDLDW